jgi:hypothetical protein
MLGNPDILVIGCFENEAHFLGSLSDLLVDLAAE